MQDLFIEFLPPWVETGLQPAFYDRESGTVLQQTARMYAKVNELVKAVNGMDKIIKEYVDYINNYFANLDVQEEINNKLDDMLESGDLETAIAQFLAVAPVFAYTTVADMVASEYLDTGCIARTLGKESVDDGLGSYYVIGETGDIELNNGKFATKVGKSLNTTLAFNTLADLISSENIEAGYTAITLGKESLNDGYGAVYTIGVTGDIALDNGLYATLQNDFGNNYYNEITISTGRANDTDYYVATIPLNDADGNLISPYVHDETDNPVNSPLQYADKNYTTLTLNAGLGRQNSDNQWVQMAVIANGVITQHDTNDIPAPEWYTYLGIKADRTLVDFPGTTTPEAMLASGVVNAFSTFGQVVTNGILTINEHWEDAGNHPLVYLGAKLDGTMIIFVCDGRTNHDTGFTIEDGASYMISAGCVNAWRLDSGGSSSMIYKGSKQNRNIDENGTKDRGVWVTLNFKKPTINKELAEAFSYIGKERQLLNKQIRQDFNSEMYEHNSTVNLFNNNTGYNIIANDSLTVMTYGNNYRHGEYIKAIYEEDAPTRPAGFEVNKTGLVKVTFTALVKCVNTAGVRSLRVVNYGTENMPTAGGLVLNTFNPTSANEYYQICGSIIFVNGTEGAKYQILGGGVNGDDFSRLYTQVEYIGASA